jgi:hypothetical protein
MVFIVTSAFSNGDPPTVTVNVTYPPATIVIVGTITGAAGTVKVKPVCGIKPVAEILYV